MTTDPGTPSRPTVRPESTTDFRTVLAFALNLADSLDVSLVGLHVSDYGGLSVQVRHADELHALADALNLPVVPSADDEPTDYLARSGPSPLGLAGDVHVTVYGGRRPRSGDPVADDGAEVSA